MRDQPTPEQTQERFAEIRQRVDALGIEPWFYVHSPQALHSHTVAEGRERRWTAVCAMTYKNDAARRDAEFIAHARQDVPFLLSQVDALTATLAHLTQERDSWRRVAERLEHEKQQAEATLARVKDALRDFGQHRPGCAPRKPRKPFMGIGGDFTDMLPPADAVCDCGLMAALVDPPVSSSTEQTTKTHG